ncbi:alpha/beta hydrolase family protein [Spirosoma areae]
MRPLTALLLFLALQSPVKAQDSVTISSPSLKNLYGDLVPGTSQRFNSILTASLILPDTKVEEWPVIRAKIYDRVIRNWGTSPVPYQPTVNKFEETGRYVNLGLTHIKYRFQVVDDIWIEAVCVLPKDYKEANQYHTILCVHGTNGALGKDTNLGTPKNRAYAIDMAQKGFVTFSADQFGYGATIKNTTEAQLYKSFYEKYPNWSLRGIRMLTLIRAVDVLEQLKFVKKGEYGSMGNSLGGSSVLFHTAIDNRVKSAVVSTGTSPYYTNVFRIMARGKLDEPLRAAQLAQTGIPNYDIHEVIALCAPRAVLFLEPFNDPYNPDVMANFKVFYDASAVYKLLGTPGRASMLIHGDGHDTIENVRDYAYKWLERYLTTSKLTN